MKKKVAMKKQAILLFSLLTLCFSFQMSVYAGSLPMPSSLAQEKAKNIELPALKFEITSGVDLTKDVESTFDFSRTITGTAEPGSEVEFLVSTKNKSETKEKQPLKVVVGASGLFSQSIDLEVGENIIEINAQKENKQSVSNTFSIKRKSIDIKKELEQNVLLNNKQILNNSESNTKAVK